MAFEFYELIQRAIHVQNSVLYENLKSSENIEPSII